MDVTKQVPKEIEDLEEAQLKKLEKNHKALRLLTAGLRDSDKKKVLSSLTAKEKWDALDVTTRSHPLGNGIITLMVCRTKSNIVLSKIKVPTQG